MNESLIEKGKVDERAAESADDPLIGKRFGVYRLEKQIGRGGMGAVYLATRDDGSFRQQAAVKLIKRGMDTDFILRRFKQERQILASLNHPLIAALLNGGTTADDLPYFVMEFVDGEPLYKFSDFHKLSIAARLKIFRQICHAVDFAHRRKIIHRDLKPSNILVTADGTPKLLDFGIAKVLNPDVSAELLAPTATAMRLMTPEYASPEQVGGLPVTPASDIYSLGVILYELLTGHRPYRFENRAPHEIARVICEEEPDRPSAGIARVDNLLPTAGSEATTLGDVSRLRGAADIETLRKEISGDLEKIVMKCLCKKSLERYQSADDLAEDITRYLEDKRVTAETFPRTVNALPKPVDSMEKSVAILPLQLLSTGRTGDTSDDIYLCLGLADALITRLSGVRRLIVRPTSSILRFQGSDADPLEAGRELGVKFVVAGTIRRVGERLRVSIQMLSVADNSTVRAEKFDENYTDALELEDLISERVAAFLIPELTDEESERLHKRGTNSPAAYESFMRGRYLANQFTNDAVTNALEAYTEAVRLDDGYALPHIGIAESYVWTAIFGALPCREAYPLAKKEIRRALEIDDSLAEAYALSAFVTMLYDWDWSEAERLVGKSLELNPHYHFAHNAYAHILCSSGIETQALDEISLAEELDPLSPLAKIMTSWISYQTRRFDRSVEKARQASKMLENPSQSFMHLGNSLTQRGETAEAVKSLQISSKLLGDSAQPKYVLCFALVADNRREEAERVLQSILKTAEKGFVKPYFVGMAHTALGNIDAAFDWFGKSVEARDEYLIWFGTDIKLDALRNDPRYDEILRLTNNPIANR